MNLIQILKTLYTPIFLIVLAIVVALHQYINWGVWFELHEVHHESFIIALLFGAIVLLSVKKRLW